jgi:hypothetical protein
VHMFGVGKGWENQPLTVLPRSVSSVREACFDP